MISITAKNFIDGGWMDPVDCFESLDPADRREIVGTAPRGTPADVDRAVAVARRTFDKWRSAGAAKRADAVDSFAQVLKRYGKEVAKYLSRESGKPLAEAVAEVQDALAIAQFSAGGARANRGVIAVPDAADNDSYAWRMPRGVVACITPGFSPVALPLRHILPALAAGDTVVWKPSEHAPVCAQWLSRLFLEAGFLEGAVNIVHGMGDTVGSALAKHPHVSAVVFAGARETAVDLHRAFGGDLERALCLEPSAVSALIVSADADVELAATAAVAAAFRTSGQNLNSADRIFVDKEIESEFIDRFAAKAKALKIGAGSELDVALGPLVSAEAQARSLELRWQAKGEVLYDGGDLGDGPLENGWFVSPFVWRADYAAFVAGGHVESRSPLVAVVPVDGPAQAVAAFNAAPARSSLAVFTRDQDRRRWIREHADCSRVYVNLPTVCSETQLLTGGGADSSASTRVKTFTVGQTTAG